MEVIVFGMGNYYRNNRDRYSNYKVVAFVDNSISEKKYVKEYGLYAYPVSHLNDVSNDILISSLYFAEIYRQLINMKIEEKRIHFGLELDIFSDNFELYTMVNKEKYELKDIASYKHALQKKFFLENECLQNFSRLPVDPFSTHFGAERGTPVDRYYIEKFIKDNAEYIKGNVLEVGIDTYTKKYGGDKVVSSVKCHVRGWNGCKTMNLETGEGIVEEQFDCFICTQTLQYIFDLDEVFKNIMKLLKNDGVALITVPGIKQLCTSDDDAWGEYWSFTYKSMEKLCSKVSNDYEVETKGNAKVSAAYLYGACLEDIEMYNLEKNDSQYPFIVTVVLKKKVKNERIRHNR